jgi:class 3 adenylate cyclase
VRKVVTILFCDLAGSTAIGERTDPEALRALMTRYYETARVVLERHGGTVEKFVGDAVMAVFGIPVTREDDALRATRAAVELRDVIQALGLEARIGVNTGDVVAGEGDTLVTGDAVNVAARLEQSAEPGEILLGETAFRLVRDAVDAERTELSVKGKSAPLEAHRVVAFDREARGVARRLERPMIGRQRERDRLQAEFDEVVDRRTCRLVTLIGPAGVGKSRLVHDFLDRVGATATATRGRALSYGEGITYWPLVEILLQLGVDPPLVIRSSPADTQLLVRARLEAAAEERPLVLVVDDLHWAEPPMLDLVEHIVDWSRERAILVLCIARPELLDVRPGWGGGKLNATSVLLDPLPADDAAALAASLLGELELDPTTRERILQTAEGNPLFLEEMALLARDAGAADVPPTIHALLQARLDTLATTERALVDRGAVEGKVFHRGAVTALVRESDRRDVPGDLLALVRKEVVRPDRTQIPGDDAFRFRHLLIRDTAYESLPKAARAELHEAFADWLAEHAGLYEQDELVGYHLERASRFRRELDSDDPRAVSLGARAAARLGVAGRAAFEREDLHAVRNLLGRAVALLPEGPERRALIPDLVEAVHESDERARADALLDELDRGEPADRALATALRAITNPIAGRAPEDVLAEIDAAQAVLEPTGDVLALARCELARGQAEWVRCHMGNAREALLRALELERSVGFRGHLRWLAQSTALAGALSGVHAQEVLTLIDDLERDAATAGPLAEGAVRGMRARISFSAGVWELPEVEATITTEGRLLVEAGHDVTAVEWDNYRSVAAWLLGRDAEAARLARANADALEGLGSVYHANIVAHAAFYNALDGALSDALADVDRARGLALADDVADQLQIDLAEALARSCLGERDAAERLLERVRLAVAKIDMDPLQEEVDVVEGYVRHAFGDEAAARVAVERAIESAERRGFRRWADRYRQDLARITGSVEEPGRH